MRAHLTAHDDLAVDDAAWATVATALPRRVLVVSPSQAGAGAVAPAGPGLAPGVHIQVDHPSAVHVGPRARRRPRGLRHLAAAAPTGYLVLAVGPPPDTHSPLGLAVGRLVAAGVLQAGDEPYGLLRYADTSGVARSVDIGAVAVDRVTPLAVPSWAYTALQTNAACGPGRRPGRSAACGRAGLRHR